MQHHGPLRRAIVLSAAVTSAVMVVGCAGKPTVGIDARADVNLSRPLPTEISPRDGALPVALGQPINVKIEGLVVEYKGTFIPEPLFSQINEGDSPEYVAAIFGKPDFESTLGDGTLVWRWKYQPQAQQGPLISLLGSSKGDQPSPDHVTALAIFKDNKLTRKWRG